MPKGSRHKGSAWSHGTKHRVVSAATPRAASLSTRTSSTTTATTSATAAASLSPSNVSATTARSPASVGALADVADAVANASEQKSTINTAAASIARARPTAAAPVKNADRSSMLNIGGVAKRKDAKRRAKSLALVEKLAVKAADNTNTNSVGGKSASAKRRVRRGVTGSAESALDTLQSLLPVLEATPFQHASNADARSKGSGHGGDESVSSASSQSGAPKLTAVRRQRIYRKEVAQLAAVAAHPAFNRDPLGAIGEHVKNAVALVQQQRQQRQQQQQKMAGVAKHSKQQQQQQQQQTQKATGKAKKHGSSSVGSSNASRPAGKGAQLQGQAGRSTASRRKATQKGKTAKRK